MQPVLRRHGVTRASIVGSTARGDATQTSDIDILVELPPDRSLLDLVDLRLELESLLGRRVDLAEFDDLHPLLRDQMLAEQVPVL